MTIDEIQSALRFDMDMMLFDANTGETYPKESLKYGNEMNYIHYCANEEAIELLDELKFLRTSKETMYQEIYNKAIDDFAKAIKPYIAQYRSAIEHNRYAFIDVNNIAEQLKGGVDNEL